MKTEETILPFIPWGSEVPSCDGRFSMPSKSTRANYPSKAVEKLVAYKHF